MSDTPSTRATSSDPAPRRDHLRLVRDGEAVLAGPPAPAAGELGANGMSRPRTIGRLIAQTAMIAESAINRRREERPAERGRTGRLLGRFR